MSGGLFTKQLLLICLIILNAGPLVLAQNESNPFDLQHRLPKGKQLPDSIAMNNDNPFDIESRKETETPVEETPEVSPPPAQNPFDIQRVKPQVPPKEQKVTKPILKTPTKKTVQPSDTRSGFLFWTILGMMIALALLVTLYRSLIIKVYRAFTNENILKLLQREQSAFVAIPYLFLYILFFLSAGIFLFQLAYFNEKISFEFKNLAYCVLGVGLFFLSKHLLLNIISFVFTISKEIRQYNFTIIIFSIILGIILIPFNIFIAFAQDSLTKTGIITAVIAIIAVYLFRALRGIFIGSKFLALHKFHFFMYLCTVEIAPLLIIIKLMLNGAIIQ